MPNNRRAFTLIEMLVVISILLILATITISLINVSMQSDRIRNGARTIQSHFEGARDRAIFTRKPVGVRLLTDEDNPLTVNAMVWVIATDPWARGTIEVRREDADNDGSADTGAEATILRHKDPADPMATPDDWWRLKQQGLLTNGQQIKLRGNWYTVDTTNLTATTPNRLDLMQPYNGSGMSSPPNVLVATFTQADNHELTLAPTVMPNQEPNYLPTGIVIDLRSSRIPSEFNPQPWQDATYSPGNWVIPTTFNGRAYVCAEITGSGNSGSTEPTWPTELGDSVMDGSVTWVCASPPLPDILFSPRGTVTGSMAAAGVIHLVLADRFDVDLGRRIGDPAKEKDELVCTLFATSGHISTHPVDTNGNGDGVPDDPFYFAETGEVAK